MAITREINTPSGEVLVLKKPTKRIEQKASLIYNLAWTEAISPPEEGGLGLQTSDELIELAKKRGLFRRIESKYGKEIDVLENDLTQELAAKYRELREITSVATDPSLPRSSKEELKAKAEALVEEIGKLKEQRAEVIAALEPIISKSAERYAEERRSSFIISECVYVKKEDGSLERRWNSMDEFLDEEDDVLVSLVETEWLFFSVPEGRELDELLNPEVGMLREIQGAILIEEVRDREASKDAEADR